MREGARYARCVCGRLPDSWGEGKLAKQLKLDKRAEEIKKKGW